MAEMTAADAIRIINKAKSYVGQPDDYCSINLTVLEKEQIAALIQQQAQTIEQLKCCGNCINWRNGNVMQCMLTYRVINSKGKCDEWQGVE